MATYSIERLSSGSIKIIDASGNPNIFSAGSWTLNANVADSLLIITHSSGYSITVLNADTLNNNGSSVGGGALARSEALATTTFFSQTAADLLYAAPSNVGKWSPLAGQAFGSGEILREIAAGGTARSPASTNSFTRQIRVGLLTAATASSVASMRCGGLFFNRDGGFEYRVRVGNSSAATVAAQSMFAGVSATFGLIASAADVSTFVNIIGLGKDAADSNWQLMHNDGSGIATKIDLGASFPATTLSEDWYELRLYCTPGAASVDYRVINLKTNIKVSGSITTNMPASSTYLGDQIYVTNNATALAAAIDVFWRFIKWNP